MILPLRLFFYFQLQFLPPALQSHLLAIFLVIETPDNVGFRHQFLHFVGEVKLSIILQTIQFLNYLLGYYMEYAVKTSQMGYYIHCQLCRTVNSTLCV